MERSHNEKCITTVRIAFNLLVSAETPAKRPVSWKIIVVDTQVLPKRPTLWYAGQQQRNYIRFYNIFIKL